MGFLDKLLHRDPSRKLDRALELVESDSLRALELVRATAENGEEPFRSRARDLQQRAAEARLEQLEAKAAKSEEEGFLEDAAEWLRAAIDLPLGDEIRSSLNARIQDLGRRADAEELEKMEQQREMPPEVDIGLPDDDEHAFEILVGMLDDDIGMQYRETGEDPEFQRAFLALHSGELEEARELLESQIERRPDDSVIRFERGRCLLAMGEFAAAKVDLEAVWPSFGDEPLDLAHGISVPSLWAETMLETGDLAALLERLDGVAEPEHGDAGLCARFARALVETEAFERAEPYLERCRSAFGADPGFPFLLAQVVHRRGEVERAIEILEVAIAPSCAAGRCGAPSKHLASFRALVALHLEVGQPPNLDRVGDLMNHLAHEQEGSMPAGDLRLLAAYHEAAGRETEAAEALRQAEELEA